MSFCKIFLRDPSMYPDNQQTHLRKVSANTEYRLKPNQHSALLECLQTDYEREIVGATQIWEVVLVAVARVVVRWVTGLEVDLV
jgi:hypothetical protein